ncbi:MAG: aldo/keto reductase [Flavobacterium sp.]|nr:aldo/keto reductase [Flavobacterium sp.]
MNTTHLSPIIAGTMNWGVWDKKLSTAEMQLTIHSCLENQITTFDHADIYGGYTTEAEFGAAFKQSGLAREQVQLISKCGIQYMAESRSNTIKHYDYRKEYIIWSAEQSIQKLQCDYLDVFLLHRPSPLMQADEIAEAIEHLKSSGKIRAFGVSNFTASQTELIRQKTEIDYNQIQFSATHIEAMLDGSLDYMQQHGIQPMAWKPLGVVFRENTPQTQRLNTLLDSLTLKYEVGVDVLLLAWILQHPAGILPVAGTANLARIHSLMKATTITLDLEDWFAVWTESMGNKVP